MKSLRLAAVLLLFFTSTTFAAEPPAAPKKPRALPIPSREFSGDFDAMVERRAIRVLVPYSRTLYFNDKGRARGITAEKIGIETSTYVRNIVKYYVAYKLMLDIQDAQKKAREEVKQGG